MKTRLTLDAENWIEVKTVPAHDGICGILASNLPSLEPDANSVNCESDNTKVYVAIRNALESLILAHASAGVDIAAPAYVSGLKVAIETITRHYEDE